MRTLKYLEFGNFFNNKRKSLRLIKGKDAYDLWHIAVRIKEITKLRMELFNFKAKRKNRLKFQYRPQKFLFLLLFFLLSKKKKILEIGSSTCESIWGINFYYQIFKKNLKNLKLRYFSFFGIETNEDFIILSKSFAKADKLDKRVKIYKSLNNFKKKNNDLKNFFFHDIATSMYIFKNAKNFANLLNKFDSGYFKNCFSLDKTFKANFSGNPATYLNLKEFLNNINKPVYLILKEKNKNWSLIPNSNYKKKTLAGFFYFGHNILKFKKNLENIKKISLLNIPRLTIKKLN